MDGSDRRRRPSKDKPRIGYFEDDGRTPVTPETRAAVRIAAEALRRAGFEVEPFLPEGLEKARELWWQFFGFAGAMLLGPLLRGHESELSPILKEFNSWAATEPAHTGESLLNTWIQRDLTRMQIFKQMERFPVLLCPVASVPAFRHGERSWQIDGSGSEISRRMALLRVVQSAGNAGRDRSDAKSNEGLPIGVQLVSATVGRRISSFDCGSVERERGPWEPRADFSLRLQECDEVCAKGRPAFGDTLTRFPPRSSPDETLLATFHCAVPRSSCEPRRRPGDPASPLTANAIGREGDRWRQLPHGELFHC